ncbi:MAG: hypothetical protein ACFFDF_01555 [Candidatus Odinarchaeota archaeon]
MESVIIKETIKKFVILGILLTISTYLVLLILITFLFKNIFITIIFGLVQVLSFFLIFTFKNNKIYSLGIGGYGLSSRESEIQITEEFIMVILQERTYFTINWSQFDVIKVQRRKFKWYNWKRILLLKKLEVIFQFYSYYPNYKAEMKYISTLSISSRNFTKTNIKKIIESLETFASELEKSIKYD